MHLSKGGNFARKLSKSQPKYQQHLIFSHFFEKTIEINAVLVPRKNIKRSLFFV